MQITEITTETIFEAFIAEDREWGEAVKAMAPSAHLHMTVEEAFAATGKTAMPVVWNAILDWQEAQPGKKARRKRREEVAALTVENLVAVAEGRDPYAEEAG